MNNFKTILNNFWVYLLTDRVSIHIFVFCCCCFFAPPKRKMLQISSDCNEAVSSTSLQTTTPVTTTTSAIPTTHIVKEKPDSPVPISTSPPLQISTEITQHFNKIPTQDESDMLGIYLLKCQQRATLQHIRSVICNYGSFHNSELQKALDEKRRKTKPVHITRKWLYDSFESLFTPASILPSLLNYVKFQPEYLKIQRNSATLNLLTYFRSCIHNRLGFTNGNKLYRELLQKVTRVLLDTGEKGRGSGKQRVFCEIFQEMMAAVSSLTSKDVEHVMPCMLMTACPELEDGRITSLAFGLSLAIYFERMAPEDTLDTSNPQLLMLLWLARIKMNTYTLMHQHDAYVEETVWNIMADEIGTKHHLPWLPEYSQKSWENLLPLVQQVW